MSDSESVLQKKNRSGLLGLLGGLLVAILLFIYLSSPPDHLVLDTAGSSLQLEAFITRQIQQRLTRVEEQVLSLAISGACPSSLSDDMALSFKTRPTHPLHQS